jgi:probable HAF family extracellular repeat protein
MAFLPMAPWWSAGLTTPQGSVVPFAGRRRVGCRTSARWAAIVAGLLGVSADGSVVVGLAQNAAGQRRAFRWTASAWDAKTSARWAAIGARLMAFPPMAPWWSAPLTTPQGMQRAFRWTVARGMRNLGTLGGRWSDRLNGVSADGSVVVGWADQRRRAGACLSLDGGAWDAGPRHAGRQ